MSPAYRTGLPCTCPDGGFSGMVLEGGVQVHVAGCQAVSATPPSSRLRILASAMEHADGTPIDPPARDRDTLPAPQSAADETAQTCEHCSGPATKARGVTHSDGRRFCGLHCHDEYDREVHGVDRREPPSARVTADELARALWETDPDAVVFVREVADVEPPKGVDDVYDWTAYERAEDIAWQRDELGLRSKWLARAEEVLAELGRRR